MRADDQPDRPKIVAILPARNVVRTVAATLDSLPRDLIDEVILVDNASHDGTANVAEKLHHRHPPPGRPRLRRQPQDVLQRRARGRRRLDPRVSPRQPVRRALDPELIATAQKGRHGLVMGSRFLPPRRALDGDMPPYKYLANRTLSFLNARLLGVHLSEFHTGFRVYSAEMLRAVDYRNNWMNSLQLRDHRPVRSARIHRRRDSVVLALLRGGLLQPLLGLAAIPASIPSRSR